MITDQRGLCYDYTKYKLQYTSHDCLYSREWQQASKPPCMAAGCVIDVHEDRVEQELELIMNLETILPDKHLIAQLEGMIASLRTKPSNSALQ